MDWELRLADEISGPAKRMASSLGSLQRQLRRVDEVAKGVSLPKVSDSLGAGRGGGGGGRSGRSAFQEGEARARLELQQQRLAQRAAESKARLEARAQASADRALQRSAQDRQRLDEQVRRRQASSLAQSARQEAASQRQQNRIVAGQNAARIKAEVRAQKDIERAAAQSAKRQAENARIGDANEQSKNQSLGAIPGQVGMIMQIAAAALAAAAAVAALGAAFTHAVVEAIAFREAAIGGLTQVMKDAGSARKTFDVGVNLSARWNLDPRETVTQLQDLVSKGFSAQDARVLLTASADLKVMNPNANIAGIMLAIGQIRSKGVLQMEELQGQLAEAGINVGKVLEIIGKKTGRTAAQVRKDISAGKVDSNTGIWAIVKSIEEMGGGKLGSVADKASKSINSMLMGLRFRPGLLGLKIAEMLEGGPGESAVRGALQQLLKATDPAQSKGMQSLLTSVSTFANSLFTVLFGPAASGGDTFQRVLKGLATGFDVLSEVVSTVGPIVSEFFGGFGEVSLGALRQIGTAFLEAFGGDKRGAIKQLSELARSLGRVLAVLAVGLGVVVAAMVAVQSAIMAMAASVGSAFAIFTAMVDNLVTKFEELEARLSGTGMSAGTFLWQGLKAGIEAGIPAVTESSANLGNAAQAGVSSSLKINSPSKVMEELGGYTVDGFTKGVEGGQGQVDAAMSGAVAPPVAAPGGAGGGGASLGGINVTVNVSGAGTDPEAMGAEVAAQVKAAVAAALEDMLAQMGLSPTPA